MSKLAISGILWGQSYINGITTKDMSERIDATTEAYADRQRAADLLARGLERAKRNRNNSLGLGE